MDDLERRVRRWTLFFIVALVTAGATAIPIPTQLAAAVHVLGEDLRAGGAIPEGMAVWLQTLRDGIRATSDRAPFMFYGTDWLAFGHFAIAFAFVGAVRDPLRNRWLYQFGMVACATVPVWAFLFGSIRGSASFRCGCATGGLPASKPRRGHVLRVPHNRGSDA